MRIAWLFTTLMLYTDLWIEQLSYWNKTSVQQNVHQHIFNVYIYIHMRYSFIRKERVLPSSRNTNLGNGMIKVDCVQKAEFTTLLQGIMSICNYQKRPGFTTQVISTQVFLTTVCFTRCIWQISFKKRKNCCISPHHVSASTVTRNP